VSENITKPVETNESNCPGGSQMSNDTPSLRSSSVLERIAELPVDVGATFLLAVAAGIVYAVPSQFAPVLRTLVGLPVLLFAPGYTLLCVLYPESGEQTDGFNWQDVGTRWLDWPARLGLSLGGSVALVPIVALTTSMAGLQPTAVPAVVAALVGAGSVVAAFRRVQVPPGRRLDIPVAALRHRRASPGGTSRARLVVASLLTISVLAATATMGYALVVPSEGESYTEIYLATENGSDELVADSFPTTFDGEPRELVVGVENHETDRTEYTVVVRLQRIETDDGTKRVTAQEELDRFSLELAPSASWERTHAVAPNMTGEDLRLTYALYSGDPPADFAGTDPYRRAYVWVDVTTPVTDGDERGSRAEQVSDTPTAGPTTTTDQTDPDRGRS
jgi:uncharacterized membrane protein